MSKTLPLALSPKAGRQIPSVGYGCWKVDKSNAADLIEEAIKCGYRHLDCAADYGNEKQVGEGIRRAIEGGVCKREDLFVTSKLWNTFHRPEHVEAACRRSLQDLGLEYLDLYLIHFPISLKASSRMHYKYSTNEMHLQFQFVPFEKRYPPEWFHEPDAPNPKMELDPVPVQDTWKSMEKLVDAGLVLNIGVSNFNVQAIRDVHSYARVKPAVLQVEMHPYLQQSVLLRFATELGMHVTAYSPMGHGDSYWNESIAAVREKEVIEVAKKHGLVYMSTTVLV